VSTEGPALPSRTLRRLVHDPAGSAKATGLFYVRSTAGGIGRRRKGKGFTYQHNGATVRDRATLDRIRALAIPPAWTDVWICPRPDGHLQATGRDVKGRKQYRYHADWSQVRGSTKFIHALEFGTKLPALRARLEQDLARPGMPREKVLAAVVSIMDHTQIRVGHAAYTRDNGSHGITTLKDHHVSAGPGGVRFRFIGKKGIARDVRLDDPRLARLVMRCKDLPGQTLFQYLDAEGDPHPIDSGMVNTYIGDLTGGRFTSKDLRTWKGTVHCVRALSALPPATAAAELTRNVNAALDEVARQLGNTRSVCRKFYVHPAVITCYERDELQRHTKGTRAGKGLLREERIVLRMLRASPRTA
jgi:DNA topoisomerase-1